MNFMLKKMEQMLSKDLGMDVERIRKESWNELDKLSGKKIGVPFRPKDMFIVGGNINLASGREMGKVSLELRNTYRKVIYKAKCLLMSKRNV